MATVVAAPQRSFWLRPKYLLAAFIGLMYAYVAVHNESFLIDAKAPIWHHYEPFKWWLLPHAITGACTILLGPMQFSDRLRQRFTKLHRIMGRIYVGGVFIAAPLGFYIQYVQERTGAPRSFSLAGGVQATTWIITTAIALAFILKGKTQQHRQWMTRSFAVALVFFAVRVVAGLGGWHTPAAVETVVWICNVFAILAADIVLQLQESWRSRAVPTKRQAVAV